MRTNHKKIASTQGKPDTRFTRILTHNIMKNMKNPSDYTQRKNDI